MKGERTQEIMFGVAVRSCGSYSTVAESYVECIASIADRDGVMTIGRAVGGRTL